MNTSKQKRKALFLTYGSFDHASSRTRAILYFPNIQDELQIKITWIKRVIQKQHRLPKIFFAIAKRLLFIKRILYILLFRYDLVFIQRLYLENFLLKKLKKKGSKIIYDFDDAIYINFEGTNQDLNKVILMLKNADQIIVSSPELKKFCLQHRFENVDVITTPVETERYSLSSSRLDKNVVIGWIGSPSTSHYLKLIVPALQELTKKFNISLVLIGIPEGFQLNEINYIYKKWSYETENKMLEEIDIGIMPLSTHEYSKGKGGYKLFQYMAAGKPVIASPVGINKDIIKQGVNGFLANDTNEWVNYLSFLIENPEERKKMGMNGRSIVVEKYSKTYCFGILKSKIQNLLSN